MLSLKEKMEYYNLTEDNVCAILDNYMNGQRLEEYITDEVYKLTEYIHIADEKMQGYKKLFEDGIEYYNARPILARIEAVESEKAEYILKQSMLVNLINEFRDNA